MANTELQDKISEASNQFVKAITVDNFKELSDKVIENCVDNLIVGVNGHAVAFWLPEQKAGEDVLTIAYNVGDKGPDVEGVISQPLDKGLVSKSFTEKTTVCHQGFFKHRDQSSSVDKELGQITAHQIASPFQLFGETVGAITVIQTIRAGLEQNSEWGFDDNDVQHFEEDVQVVQRLFELNVIRQLQG